MSVFKIISGTAGYGNIATGGACGYDCPESAGRFILPIKMNEDAIVDVISAHSPSEVIVEFYDPVSVCGVMAATGFAESVDVLIDHHVIGNLSAPALRLATPYVNLAPGTYRLQCLPRSVNYGAHTGFVVKRDKNAPSKRLAILAWAFYSHNTLNDRLGPLFRTAALRGIHVRAIGVGVEWRGLTDNKLHWTAENLEFFARDYDYLCLVDAFDMLVLRGERDILEVCKEKDEVLISAEMCSWPMREKEWYEAWSAAGHGHEHYQHVNSGVIAGPKDDVVQIFQECSRLARRISAGEVELMRRFARYTWCDQFVWAAMHLLTKQPALDHDGKLALALGCTGVHFHNNEAFKLGETVRSLGGHVPCFIHMCGPAKGNIALWERLIS